MDSIYIPAHFKGTKYLLKYVLYCLLGTYVKYEEGTKYYTQYNKHHSLLVFYEFIE